MDLRPSATAGRKLPLWGVRRMCVARDIRLRGRRHDAGHDAGRTDWLILARARL